MAKERFKLHQELQKKDNSANHEKVLEDVKEKLEKERTMKVSIKEGAASSVMSGLTGDYITPFALILKANNAQIGFLTSIPGLLSPIAQIFGSKIIEKYSRNKIIFVFVVLQALMWLPMALLTLFFWKNMFVEYLPLILIVFYTLLSILGSIAGPAWFSLLGDIVPERIRGKYFGKRNKICGTITLISTFTASFLLDYFKTKGLILLGFSILFTVATIFRLISAFYFKKHYEPKLNLNNDYYFSFIQFIKKALFNNYGRFTIFVAIFYIGVTFAGPFFSVYMLKNLGFSFKTYMIVNVSASIFSLLFMPIWGKLSDKYGNRELIKIGAILVGIMPILWIVSPNPIFLILVPQLLSGIGWAAFNLGAGNFIYDIVTRERRAICVAYYNVVVGVGVFIGSIAGGLVAQYASIGFMNKFLFIFVLSGIFRLLAGFIMIPLIKEVRNVEKPRQNLLFYLKDINPEKELGEMYMGVQNGISNGLKRIKKIVK